MLSSFRFSQLDAAAVRTSSARILPSLFDMLADEILAKEISRWLPDQPPTDQGAIVLPSQKKLSPLSAYACTAKRFHLLLQPERIVKKFLYAVVNANQKAAEDILIRYPHLLSRLLQQKLEVTDYSGRHIDGAALQIALGAEDVKYHDDEECMAEMLLRYLKQLPNGDAIIDKQIAEQFPEGWEKAEKAREERDLATLKKVVLALENAATVDDCAADVKEFQDYLKNKNKNRGVIKTGKHFNMQLLIEAFKLYDEKFNQFGGRGDSPKNILFWLKIIGDIERFVPACYAQAICQGVYYIVKHDEKLQRRLTFRFDPHLTYYPLDTDPKLILGEDYAAQRPSFRPGGRRGGRDFTIYVKQKAATGERLCGRSQTYSQRIAMS